MLLAAFLLIFMLMKKYLVLLSFSLFSFFVQAQHLGVFEDDQNRFYIFDTDHFDRSEHIPVQEYWVGKNYVAFVRNNGRFIIYYEGKEHEISLAEVRVEATDNYLVYFVDEQIWLFDGKEIKLMDPWIKATKQGEALILSNFALNDSALAFTNSFDRFLVSVAGKNDELELWDVKNVRAGENIIAYVDDNDVFKAFYNGERFIVEDRAPKSYVPKADIIAYIDDFGTFKVWYKNEITELQEIVPNRYHVADKMVAYLDDMTNFVCFYDGELYDILPYQPKRLVVQDNILLYADNRDFHYVFYKGKIKRISAYKPRKIVVQDDFVVFQDLDGYIKAFQDGEIIAISDQIAIDFEVYNETVIYKINEYTWVGYYQGKRVEYIPQN